MLLWKEGWKGYRRWGKRWERVQEMGETVETVLGFRDGVQVHSSFHTDVKELEYKDLLTSTFTLKYGSFEWEK
jgi:hypothetical protein